MSYKNLLILILLQLSFMSLRANDSNEIGQLQIRLQNTADLQEEIELLYILSKKLSHTDFELSLEYGERGLQKATESRNYEKSAQFNALLGQLYLEGGRKEEALEKIETAIKIAQQKKTKEN